MIPELSIVVSGFNEEKNIPSLFTKLTEMLDKNKIDAEIIFLNNHSTDNSEEVAAKYAAKDKRIKVINRINRPSKDLGGSLKEGFVNAKGRYLIIMDADLSHDPNEIPRLMANRNKADIIIGSRYTGGGKGDMPLSRVIISKTYNWVARVLFQTKVKDITTGFKLYKKSVIDSLKLVNNGFGLHVEIFLKAINKGYTTMELPIHYRARQEGKSSLSYRKQFLRYSEPLLESLKEKFFKK